MTKARRMMQEDIKLVDLLIELTDARAPMSGRNPDIDSLAQGKSRIILLNKADLADESVTKAWMQRFQENGVLAQAVDSRVGSGVRQIRPLIEEACREKTERDRRRGILNRPVRAMIAGIPNVGKSTFINSFAGKAVARTGDKPGVTRGKQWIRLSRQIELLDTPGILWPKFDDQVTGMRLALLGSISDERTDRTELAIWLICYLEKEYAGILEERYSLSARLEQAERQMDGAEDQLPEGNKQNVDNLKKLASVALARGCMKAGGKVDLEKASAALIDDLRSGKLGRITLEKPEI